MIQPNSGMITDKSADCRAISAQMAMIDAGMRLAFLRLAGLFQTAIRQS